MAWIIFILFKAEVAPEGAQPEVAATFHFHNAGRCNLQVVDLRGPRSHGLPRHISHFWYSEKFLLWLEVNIPFFAEIS